MNFASTSSSTNTQSNFLPDEGAVKRISGWLSNLPIKSAIPVRGLNHQAFTCRPLMAVGLISIGPSHWQITKNVVFTMGSANMLIAHPGCGNN